MESLVKEAYEDIKSAAYIDATIHYAETLLGIRFKSVKKNRYSALCPFRVDTKDNLTVSVKKEDEVRFHCFGACKADWDIYDMIMLRLVVSVTGPDALQHRYRCSYH